jgi:hypothetical protein
MWIGAILRPRDFHILYCHLVHGNCKMRSRRESHSVYTHTSQLGRTLVAEWGVARRMIQLFIARANSNHLCISSTASAPLSLSLSSTWIIVWDVRQPAAIAPTLKPPRVRTEHSIMFCVLAWPKEIISMYVRCLVGVQITAIHFSVSTGIIKADVPWFMHFHEADWKRRKCHNGYGSTFSILSVKLHLYCIAARPKQIIHHKSCWKSSYSKLIFACWWHLVILFLGSTQQKKKSVFAPCTVHQTQFWRTFYYCSSNEHTEIASASKPRKLSRFHILQLVLFTQEAAAARPLFSINVDLVCILVCLSAQATHLYRKRSRVVCKLLNLS